MQKLKILEFPAYISIANKKSFSRNLTGYGYITLEIALSLVSLNQEVDLITQSNITFPFNHKGLNILSRTYKNILFNIRFKDFFQPLKSVFGDRIALNRVLNIFLYNLSLGYLDKLIKIKKYDVIHIHGISYYTEPIINFCIQKNLRLAVTLHGLNSFSNSVKISESEKKLEKKFLKIAQSKNIPVSVISTGIRKTILDFLGLENSKNFQVIPNSFHESSLKSSVNYNIRLKHNLGENTKIFICVGNFSTRKNQIQIIRTFKRLDPKMKENSVFLFIGKDLTGGKINSFISNDLIKNIKIVGEVPRSELHNYYSQADFNLLVSISEGYGMSVIEGYSFGLPSLIFHDIDASEDFYCESSMIRVQERSDEALKQGLTELYNKEWNRNEIKCFSQKFNYNQMATKYYKFLKKC